MCFNNTIYGTKFNYIPDTGDIPLVADMSSCIISEPVDVSKFGLIYAGAQKNMAPAGLTVVIVREDLIGNARPETPSMLDYKLMADNEFYTAYTIPAGTYAKQDTDVTTVTVKATLIVDAKASEDAVYAITAAIFDNIDAITAEHAKGAELTLENATTGMAAPFHAGAAKYFAEKGITVPTN